MNRSMKTILVTWIMVVITFSMFERNIVEQVVFAKSHSIIATEEIATKKFSSELKSKDGKVVLKCSFSYPQIKSALEEDNTESIKRVNFLIESHAIKKYEEKCKESMGYTTEFFQQEFSSMVPDEWFPFVVDVTYNTTLHQDGLFSFVYTDFEWYGGAHPETMQYGFIYDYIEGKILEAKDLLTLDETGIKQYIADEMKKQYEKNPEIYFKEEVERLQKLDFEYETYANEEGIVFFFQTYAVAPYVTGIVSVPLKYTDHPELFQRSKPFQN